MGSTRETTALSLVFLNCALQALATFSPNAFDDSILFKLNWPGQVFILTDFVEQNREYESMTVRTHQDETYFCVLPTIKEKEQAVDEEYYGPNPLELLNPLFQASVCSSRLESYWTYEICHGKYVKQYHEDREGQKVNLQEYYLGRWDKFMFDSLNQELEKGKLSAPSVKKLDGMTLPYLQLNFTDGTVCDINGKPRRTNVLYVCYTHGKNDIYSIKEVSTCEYEVIILTTFLCKHPKYRPQESSEHNINCLPVPPTSKRKPQSLTEFEAESTRMRPFKSFGDVKIDKLFSIYSIQEYKDEDGRKQVRVELLPLDDGSSELEQETPDEVEEPQSPVVDGSGDVPLESEPITTAPIRKVPAPIPLPIKNFVTGKDCLRGGSGWWKFKFCYGDSVKQYHIEKDFEGATQKTEIVLGVFKKEAHIEWLKKNPHKRPKALENRKFFTHFYSDGSPCEKTGRPRETEVKLKCTEGQGSVSLYLLEPQVCRYELGVEAPLICELLDKLDENALVDIDSVEW